MPGTITFLKKHAIRTRTQVRNPTAHESRPSAWTRPLAHTAVPARTGMPDRPAPGRARTGSPRRRLRPWRSWSSSCPSTWRPATGRIWLPLLATGPALAAATSLPGVLGVGALAILLGASIAYRHDMAVPHLSVVLAALVTVTLASAPPAPCGHAVSGAGRRALRRGDRAARAAPAGAGEGRPVPGGGALQRGRRRGPDRRRPLRPRPHSARRADDRRRRARQGLPAVGTAALVLGVFREAAYDEPDLLDVVCRIERSLARNLGGDDFVTAVVAAARSPGGWRWSTAVTLPAADPRRRRDGRRDRPPRAAARTARPVGPLPASRWCPSATATSCSSTPTASPRRGTTSAPSTPDRGADPAPVRRAGPDAGRAARGPAGPCGRRLRRRGAAAAAAQARRRAAREAAGVRPVADVDGATAA